MSFKAGDRVVVTKNYDGFQPVGAIGVIVGPSNEEDDDFYDVDFKDCQEAIDCCNDLHDCAGELLDNTGWCFHKDAIRLEVASDAAAPIPTKGFKVGDKVEVTGRHCLAGAQGKIAQKGSNGWWLVDFGVTEINEVLLHDCGGMLPAKTGWWMPPSDLKFVSSHQLEDFMPATQTAVVSIGGAAFPAEVAHLFAKMIGAPAPMTAHDVTVERSKEVKQITLPDGMPISEAITWLQRKQQDEEKKVAIVYEIEGFPLDVAVNFYDALLDVYGFVQKADTPGFFGPSPPTMIGIPVGPNEVRQVPWGRIVIPGIDGYVKYEMKPSPSGQSIVGNKLLIVGEIKQKNVPDIEKIVAATKERLKTHSIYKGKAVELDLTWTRTGAFDPTGSAPKFTIPLDGADKHRLIFSAQTAQDIQVGLFTALEHPDLCKASDIPIKRGVLLAGEFGTGKTMTAWVAAKMAVSNGMGFIYLKHVEDLAACFEFARMYQEPGGVVVFAEDLNKAIDEDEDCDGINKLQNAFDGVNTKTDKIITVLTTNFIDRVPQSLLRPGRIDLLVKVERPDAEAAVKLVKLYGGTLLSRDLDYAAVGKCVAQHLPAEIREIIERSKMACIARTANLTDRQGFSIIGKVTEDDIAQAARQMRLQHELLKPKAVDERSERVKAAEIAAAATLKAAAIAAQNGELELEDSLT